MGSNLSILLRFFLSAECVHPYKPSEVKKKAQSRDGTFFFCESDTDNMFIFTPGPELMYCVLFAYIFTL